MYSRFSICHVSQWRERKTPTIGTPRVELKTTTIIINNDTLLPSF